MNDAKFLEACGIEIDLQWLAQLNDQKPQTNLTTLMEHESTSKEVRNYVRSLAEIANMLGPYSQQPKLKL
jgi:hypothetical protein